MGAAYPFNPPKEEKMNDQTYAMDDIAGAIRIGIAAAADRILEAAVARVRKNPRSIASLFERGPGTSSPVPAADSPRDLPSGAGAG